MHTHTSHTQKIAAWMIIALIACTHIATASAAESGITYELRPHCTSIDVENLFGGPMPDIEGTTDPLISECASFGTASPVSKQTPVLNSGDTLDMDLIIRNPNRKKIQRFRAWIAYDPSVIEGIDVQIANTFPTPTPGEDGFIQNEGYIKLSGTAEKDLSDEVIPVAHIRVTILPSARSSTPLLYAEVTADGDSVTGVYGSDDTINLLEAKPGELIIRMHPNSSAATSSHSSEIAQSRTSSASSDALVVTTSSVAFSSSSSSSSNIGNTIFTLLQVQGLRVTTEGSAIFLAWDPLPSAELAGYNLYYGTTMGQYIQRRSTDASSTTIAIRNLPLGIPYYFAVRGVSAAQEETEFSQEVGITVGSPSTSTSPLTANSLPFGTPETNGSVAGETGASSILLVLVVLSGLIGTGLAFRRQWSAQRS